MSETAKKLPLPTYDEVIARVMPLVSVLPAESVDLMSARGRVLRAAVVADRDQPPFDRSAMDGFAIRCAEFKAGSVNKVTGSVAAGQRDWERLSDHAGVIRIATGAPVPPSFDAVIPIEQTNVTASDGSENSSETPAETVVFILDSVSPWQNVHRQGKDAQAGQPVIASGTQLGPAHVGIGAAVGAQQVNVTVQPRITLLTSGDEVKPFATATGELESQQIRNSNGPMLTAFFEALGTPLLQHVHVPDEPEQTLAAAREALSHSHLVVTVGGVSVGQRDLLPWAWQKLGLNVIQHGVAIQPGKPVFIAGARPDQERSPSALEAGEGGGTAQDKVVVGLPGNPVSVLATAHLFVWPIVRRMLGLDATLPWRSVSLAEPMQARAARQLFRAVRINEAGKAASVAWHGSGDLMHTANAQGWVRLPQRDGEVEPDESVAFLKWVG